MNKTIVVGRKISNVGTKTPWNARIFVGIMKIRDHIFQGNKNKILEFDHTYNPILQNLDDAYKNLIDLEKILDDHEKELAEGRILEVANNSFFVIKPIDQDVRRLFRGFINALVTAIKHTQYVAKIIDIKFDIGFLFGKQINFENKIREIRNNKSILFDLMAILEEIRPFTNEIIELVRNEMEHPNNGFTLPNIEYDFENKKIKNNYYSKEKMRYFWENGWRICEIIIVYCFSKIIKYPWVIKEISKDQRDPAIPIKYKPWIDKNLLQKIEEDINRNSRQINYSKK